MKFREVIKNIDVIFLIIVGLISLGCALGSELILGRWQVPRGIGVILGILVFLMGLVGEIRNVLVGEECKEEYTNYAKQTLNFINQFSGKVEISLSSLLANYPAVQQKFHSPISIFVDTEIARVLDELSRATTLTGEPILNLDKVPSGMVWVVKDADLSTYARVAIYFDEAALQSPNGYIYSTNTVLPSEFNNDPHRFVATHIDTANQFANSHLPDSSPRLLRLQLLHENAKPPETIINLKDEFLNDLDKLKENTPNYENCNFKKYCSPKHYYVLNVDDSIIKSAIAPLMKNQLYS